VAIGNYGSFRCEDVTKKFVRDRGRRDAHFKGGLKISNDTACHDNVAKVQRDGGENCSTSSNDTTCADAVAEVQKVGKDNCSPSSKHKLGAWDRVKSYAPELGSTVSNAASGYTSSGQDAGDGEKKTFEGPDPNIPPGGGLPWSV